MKVMLTIKTKKVKRMENKLDPWYDNIILHILSYLPSDTIYQNVSQINKKFNKVTIYIFESKYKITFFKSKKEIVSNHPKI